MKTTQRILSVALVALLFSWRLALAGEEVLSVMVLDMPPWFIKGEDGRWDGLGMELGRTLAEKAGFQTEATLLPWSRGMEYLKIGERVLFVNLSRTRERENFVDYIGVSAFDRTALILRQENIGLVFETLDDLARPGYFWGIRDNSFYSEEFHGRLRDDAVFASHFESVAQFGINYARIKGGRLIGAFGDLFGMRYMATNNPEYQGLVVVTVPFFPPTPTFFGVSRKLPEKQRRRLHQAYELLVREGAFSNIVEKWTSVGP